MIIPRRNAITHIRAALKQTFPEARFWVRKQDDRCGVNYYVIRWIKTPEERAVQELASALMAAAKGRILIHCVLDD